MANGLELHYDFSQLDQCIGNINDLIRETGLISANITSLGNQLDRNWEGAANKAYNERHKALLEKIRKLGDEMSANRDKLVKSVDEYRTNEQTQVKNVNALSDEDIF